VLLTIITIGIGLAVPILWAALGEIIAEQAGVINIGVEGVMLIAALITAMVMSAVDNFLISMLAGLGVGIAVGVVLGWFYVYRGMNQIITGIVFNIFALGLTTALFTYAEYLSEELQRTLPNVSIPLLSDLPWVGEAVFQQDLTFYGAVLASLVVFHLLLRSWFGLYVRAAGQRPSAVVSTGRDVRRVRFAAVIFACAMAGIGGATLVLSVAGSFNVNLTAGQGIVALAVVVLARWNPFVTVIACIVFGMARALQFQVENLGVLADVPVEVWIALPYIVTIVALVFARGSRYPPALGIPFIPPGKSWAQLTWERIRDRFTGGRAQPQLEANP
jgi:simple sugar transport system permease protein